MSEEESSYQDPLGAFPDQVRQDVDGLMWLGYLEDEFDFAGHHFVIRTLRGDEDLLTGLVTKEYAETMSQAKANVWSQIALALIAVDGDEDFCPPAGPDKRNYARARLQYCTSRWFWPTAVFIYTRFTGLLDRQAEAVRAVEDLASGSLHIFTPSASSLTDRADSEPDQEVPEVEMEDIREYLGD